MLIESEVSIKQSTVGRAVVRIQPEGPARIGYGLVVATCQKVELRPPRVIHRLVGVEIEGPGEILDRFTVPPQSAVGPGSILVVDRVLGIEPHGVLGHGQGSDEIARFPENPGSGPESLRRVGASGDQALAILQGCRKVDQLNVAPDPLPERLDVSGSKTERKVE